MGLSAGKANGTNGVFWGATFLSKQMHTIAGLPGNGAGAAGFPASVDVWEALSGQSWCISSVRGDLRDWTGVIFPPPISLLASHLAKPCNGEGQGDMRS